MLKRSICLFPAFKNIDRIQQLRKQYDPLYQLIPPHITLVFPFSSELSNDKLQEHVHEAVKSVRPFKLKLQGITGSTGGYLFLNVKEGNDQIIKLHDRLYTGILEKHLLRKVTYTPHMTVGRLDNPVEFEKALQATKGAKEVFEITIEEVVSEVIDEKGDSTVEFREVL